MSDGPRTISRRGLLAGGAAMALAGCVTEGPQATPGPDLRHQPGILTAPPTTAVFAAFDIRVPGREALAGVLRQISVQVAAAPSEILVSVGASLFDDRYGLAARRPAALTTMPSFPNDVLDSAWCHGDLLVQVCAPDATTAQSSLSSIERTTGAALVPRWRMPAFRPENTMSATGRPTTRNLFGFEEGISNPDVHDAATMAQLVWVAQDDSEPHWTAGGSYQVIRLVRFATQLWDREPLSTQESVFGRRRSDGAPLGRGTETEDFTYADDPTGQLVALDAHIRRANPRTPETAGSRILRRGYSYRTGTDAGLVFVCFQRDLGKGFETVQGRLTGEALDKYILSFGGGYFFALPGVAPGQYLGADLLAA
ncbi:Dyp-type peroxidase [Actinocrispum wychmicini]|uniref:Deferrochelatase/peroxidase EfeB n=1 Tax=Actinocrispum wychmicini TaxID=1213861 RepID=A0A4R2JHC6_9PSEU|nr:Dyp-type peroxidase [Actinocrispum wychmicini]TCO55789.1 deferrochelatase/peroxidase EfeB [Actinocrispum wychmicini]